jgi:hypothetical protein
MATPSRSARATVSSSFFGQAFFPLNVLNAVIHSAPDPFMPELLIPVFFDEARSSFCILGQDTYAPEAASVLD